jgi:hypothetical protein
MRALLWKEVRENLVWALLALVAVGGGLLYGLYHTRYGGRMTFEDYEGMTLLRKQFLLMTTFGFPAVGLFLGFMQMLPEQKRDRWAALLHRPIPPEWVLLGKLLGGVVLYVLAAVVPFAVTVWLVATPGNFAAPFVPGLALAGSADLLVGFVYCLAAFAMVLPRAGWLPRSLPLLAAVDLSFLAQKAELFRVVAGSALALSLALAVASLGLIREPASFASRGVLRRLAFLAVAFFGLCGVADLGRSLLDAVWPEPRRTWMYYEVTKDGVPLRLTYTNGVVTEVADAEGRPVDDPKLSASKVRNQVAYLNGVCDYIGDSHGWKPREWKPPYRQTSKYLHVGQTYAFPQPEQWFGFVPSRSWICYEPVGKAPIARLDAGGFQPPPTTPQPLPTDERFENLRSDCYLFWNERGVRIAHLATRRIEDLALPAPLPVFGVGSVQQRSSSGVIEVTAFALSDGLAVYDKEWKLLALLPYTQDVSEWGRVSFGMSPEGDRFFVQYQPSAWMDPKVSRKMPSFLDVVDAQGQRIKSTKLNPLPEFARPQTLSGWLAHRLHSPVLFFGTMAYQKVGESMGSARLGNALKSQLADRWPQTRERMIWILSLSALCAVAAWVLGRRAHRSARSLLAWTAFVFAFNLAGLLVFRLVADWPTLVPCPACRRRRPVARDACPACGQTWEAPAATGIEIMDRTPATPPRA